MCTTSADDVYVATQSELPNVTDKTDESIPSKFDEPGKSSASERVTSQRTELFEDKPPTKPKPFIYDSSYHSCYESYLEEMHLTCAKHEACGSKIEIPWEDIVLQPKAGGVKSKPPKQKKVVSDFAQILVKTISDETSIGELPEGEKSPLIKSASVYARDEDFDVEISFMESASNIINVDGMAAASQRTLSAVSTISDLRMQIKRCPKDFIITVHTVDGGVHQVHGGTELKTVGSQPFEVTTVGEDDDPRVPKFVITVPGNVDTIHLVDERGSDYSDRVASGGSRGGNNSSAGNGSPAASNPRNSPTIMSTASEPDSIKSEIEIMSIEPDEDANTSDSVGRTAKPVEGEEFFRVNHGGSSRRDLETPRGTVGNAHPHRGVENGRKRTPSLKSKSETGTPRWTRTDSIRGDMRRHCCHLRPLHEKLDVLKEKVYLKDETNCAQKDNGSNYVSVVPCSFMFSDCGLGEPFALAATDFYQVPGQVQDDFGYLSCPQHVTQCTCFGQCYVNVEDMNNESPYWEEMDVEFDSDMECTSVEESSASSHSSTTSQEDSSAKTFRSDSKSSDDKFDCFTNEIWTHTSWDVDNIDAGGPSLVKMYKQQCDFDTAHVFRE